MKFSRFFILIAAALFVATPAIARDQAPDAPKASAPDVALALTQWKAAVEGNSLDDIMKLYDRHAIVISTFAQEPMTAREQIAGYFKKVIANPDVKIDIQNSHPRAFGNVAVSSGTYNLSYTQEVETISIPARFTFVYLLEGGKWLIVEQHSSRVPLPDADK